MTQQTSVQVRHNFETAHRLPELGGKCVNLHGHSWWLEATVTAVVGDPGEVVCEFGALKVALRTWVDANLDHGAMLGVADPLLPALSDAGRVFVFGKDEPAADLPWPTVEATAHLLTRVTTGIAADLDPRLVVTHMRVTETHVNAAEVHST
jgi:6-pyruvoyltetrahydropterin/6-carboxytetrahydropterin synthase